MTHPLRCETCKKKDCRVQIMKHRSYTFEKIPAYTLDPHDKCEEMGEFVQGISFVGCASHSDAGKEREKVLDEYTELLKRRIIESDLKTECYARLSMIIHNVATELRSKGDKP